MLALDEMAELLKLETGTVMVRVDATLRLSGPADEAYLTSLRADGFALSGEGAPAPCDAPVCFLTGQRDRVTGFASLCGALRSFEHAACTGISSPGHYLPLEQSAVLAAVTPGAGSSRRLFTSVP